MKPEHRALIEQNTSADTLHQLELHGEAYIGEIQIEALIDAVRAQTVDTMTKALSDVAKAYTLGTQNSRAIVTATEHARIAVLGSIPETGT